MHASDYALLATKQIDCKVTNAETKREEILKVFNSHFSLYENLFRCVSEKGHFVRSEPLRHPLIFYLGHTAVFYINKLVLAKLLKQCERIDSKMESLMAIGVDEMSWDDLLSNDFPWPSVQKVMEYRESVRKTVSDVIMRVSLSDNCEIDWNHPLWVILMGIDHERIHLETSTLLIRQLELEYLNDVILSPFNNECTEFCSDESILPVNNFVTVDGGATCLGRPLGEARNALHNKNRTTYYGWDNEFGFYSVDVKSFKVQEKLISNREFFEFVKNGGYENQSYWSKEGWSWVQFSKTKHPKFWVMKSDGSFVLRNIFTETKAMPWDWPAEVNCLEANAYCRWAKKRLMTEEEYKRCIDVFMPDSSNLNISLKYSSPCPTSKFKQGLFDLMGNVWQWTSTTMFPFEGFRVHPLYDDFTEPTFDDKHNIFKGGSWISCGNESSHHSRYAFRRHFFQIAGFRCVNEPNINDDDYIPRNVSLSVHGDSSSSNPYETDNLVNQYVEFHFGGPNPMNVPNFPLVCSRICEYFGLKMNKNHLRALDMGCAVGKSSFELGNTFDQVVGVDFSARFIQVGYLLLKNRRLRYAIPIEGEIMDYKEVILSVSDDKVDLPFLNEQSKLNLEHSVQPLDVICNRVTFIQGDACNMGQQPFMFGFDVVLAANLIDRLPNPNSFLSEIHNRMNSGGYLVILSPYTWLPEYTPKESWIGGKKVDGENVLTREGLALALCQNFDQVIFENGSYYFAVPMVIRETSRKYQYTFSECTVWKRK